jgi:hypothetical protein
MTDDLLDALLREAQREQALAPETLDAFAEALRARAERVLGDRVRPVEERVALLAREKDALLEEIEGVRAQHRSSSEAHDRLLAHHRQVIASVVAALEPLSSDLPWGYARVRARLQELLTSLRREIE